MADRFYSIIIPVYNRPEEIDELLESLTRQTFRNFEVIIVEDGSALKCDRIIEKYIHELKIAYYYKDNAGQGFARNYGYERANGNYFIVFDSDCILPEKYLETVEDALDRHYLDAYGGPDRAHDSFTPLQKAIDYSMTSILTTGGIRNRNKAIGGFSPKSFNMGISKEVYHATGGYIIPFKGEDIEFSTRIRKMGFNVGLIENAYVYHKRRTSWIKFFQQLHFFGTARINISRFFPDQLKLVHFFPSAFTVGLLLTLIFWIFVPEVASVLTAVYVLYFLMLFLDALFKKKNLPIAVMAIWASLLQLTAYGIGLLQEFLSNLIRRKI